MIKEELTEKIIGCFYNVYNALGWGFLEKVYENALKIELEAENLKTESQRPITVMYKRQKVGDYYADLIVENQVIIEIKAAEKVISAHEAQLVNYLKSTDKEVGLLFNFGPKAQVVRKIFTNDRKNKDT